MSLTSFRAAALPRALLLLRSVQQNTLPASTVRSGFTLQTPKGKHRGCVKSMTQPQAARVHPDTMLSCTQLQEVCSLHWPRSPRGGLGAISRGAATEEASFDTTYQAQTAVPQSNYQALDAFHCFISIWQDLKFQYHKTQSYYFISGKCTTTSLESCPSVIKGRVQCREWRCRISSHQGPQPGREEPLTPQDCTFFVALLKPNGSIPWPHQQNPVISYNTHSCWSLHIHMKQTTAFYTTFIFAVKQNTPFISKSTVSAHCLKRIWVSYFIELLSVWCITQQLQYRLPIHLHLLGTHCRTNTTLGRSSSLNGLSTKRLNSVIPHLLIQILFQ